MLTIWTAAKTADVTNVFGRTMKGFRPNIPDHEVVAWSKIDPVEQRHLIPDPGARSVVLVCGAKPLDTLQKAGIAPKNRKVTSMRETPIKATGGGWYLTTYDPGILASEPHQRDVIDWDTRLAVRLMTTSSLKPVTGVYRWVNSYTPMIERIKAAYEETGVRQNVALDTETMGLHPWYDDKEIVSISFTFEAGTSELIYVGPTQGSPVPEDPDVDLAAEITWLLNDPRVKLRGANLKYDLIWIIVKLGIRCTNFMLDTMLVGSLINENRSNSLNLHAKVYTPLGGYDDAFNATYDKGQMQDVPLDDLLPYAGGDTDACQQSADVMVEEIMEDPELARFYVTVVHPAARAFEEVERIGVCVDVQKYEALRDEATAAKADFAKEAIDLLPAKMRAKWRDKINSQLEAGKSPLLPSILKDYFFGPDGLKLKPKMWTEASMKEGVAPHDRIPSTSRAHLTMFHANQDAQAMVSVLSNLNSTDKVLSTFISGFLKHLRPDGRFHPSYMLFHGAFNDSDSDDDESGSTTGRLAAKEPAIQTLPKKHRKTNKINWAKKLRACYNAPPGKVILQLDYSQGELRVVACIAEERTMLANYEAGLDMHAVTGASIAEIDFALFMEYKAYAESKIAEEMALYATYDDARDRAKPANFGLLYGMSAEGFIEYAWASYGRQFTIEEARDIRDKFFKLYPGLLDYHEAMISLAHRIKQVRSPMGRVRHLDNIDAWDRAVRAKAERRAINAPVQATLTDMMIWAIALLLDAYPNGEFEVFAVIHDAVYAYVDADKAVLRAGQAKEVMMNLPFHKLDWAPQLDFPADATSGLTLATLGKVEDMALAA